MSQCSLSALKVPTRHKVGAFVLLALLDRVLHCIGTGVCRTMSGCCKPRPACVMAILSTCLHFTCWL